MTKRTDLRAEIDAAHEHGAKRSVLHDDAQLGAFPHAERFDHLGAILGMDPRQRPLSDQRFVTEKPARGVIRVHEATRSIQQVDRDGSSLDHSSESPLRRHSRDPQREYGTNDPQSRAQRPPVFPYLVMTGNEKSWKPIACPSHEPAFDQRTDAPYFVSLLPVVAVISIRSPAMSL